MQRFVLITGCSGGGKSTLLDALSRRGFDVIAEPGRRVIAQERATNGTAFPWIDPHGFTLKAIAMARDDLSQMADRNGVVFFDRGLLDAAVALRAQTGCCLEDVLGPKTQRIFHRTVFVAPPWPEIFGQDQDRKHSLSEAIDEYSRICTALNEYRYVPEELPKVSVATRADFVLNRLKIAPPP